MEESERAEGNKGGGERQAGRCASDVAANG